MQQPSAAEFNASEPHSTAVASVADGASRVSPDRIIYTPANVRIVNSSYNLDFVSATTNFVITESNSTQQTRCLNYPHTDYYGQLTVASQSGGGVLSSSGYATALPSGAPIGSSYGEKFAGGTVTMEKTANYWEQFFESCFNVIEAQGNWYDVTAYAGLTFPIRGQTHYGWAQFKVYNAFNLVLGAYLTGYAYQTRAGKSIRAGQM
jgi:hypothetical protein